MKWAAVSFAGVILAAALFIGGSMAAASRDNTAAPTTDPIRVERCKAALAVRDDIKTNGAARGSNPVAHYASGPLYATPLAAAEADVARYC
jgi:hypothetical protein